MHGNELLVGFEIDVRREDTGTDELLLEDIDEIEEILGLTATNIIDGIGRNGKAILALFALGGSCHDTDDALDDIIDIGEVTTTVAIVEDLDGFALQELVGEAEIGHVRTSCRAIDGEETEACGGDIVELRIAMGKELVALLGGCIEGDWVINTVIGAEGDLLVAAIDAGAAGIDEVLDTFIIEI